MRRFFEGRHAGLLVPLFSLPSTDSWGVGEIPDLPVLAAWLRQCGLDILQLLPVNEMSPGQNSPYSALSALALDPIYIGVARIPEFEALGGMSGMTQDARERLRHVQQSPTIQYREVRR